MSPEPLCLCQPLRSFVTALDSFFSCLLVVILAKSRLVFAASAEKGLQVTTASSQYLLLSVRINRL